jgi:hypothetical protein
MDGFAIHVLNRKDLLYVLLNLRVDFFTEQNARFAPIWSLT